jgi:hypothetical protein
VVPAMYMFLGAEHHEGATAPGPAHGEAAQAPG